MPFARKDLLDTLNLAKPALASKDLVEELVCFWFDGKTVWAYSDIIGIQIPLATDFVGGLRGNLILGLLEKSRAKDVTISPSENGEMLLKAANAKLTLALLENERALWEVPDFDKGNAFVVDKSFIKAIENVLVSIGGDTSVPDQLGVTLLCDDQFLDMYTTDNSTISWQRLDKPKGYNVERVVIPAAFCEQLLRLMSDGCYLIVNDESVMAKNNKNIFLFSRVVDCPRPLDLVGQVQSELPEDFYDKLVTLPTRLKLAIERIMVVLQGQVGNPAKFYVDEKKQFLRLFSKSDLGEVRDSMKLEEEHLSIELNVDPTLVKRSLEGRTHFMLTENCMILFGPDDFIHLISSSS